ncbi:MULTISPECIES: DUF262 domain-containing protein [unclassified Nocardia]|uniref:GmrSD restriction endonuclease domain-containing protein n=1 Tax=unclassified Nocardia TaxID=2637762 RepID=UPI001CE40687|nr:MULTISPECIES: DUF262 domain-containing protein [unclassified Nocardia]
MTKISTLLAQVDSGTLVLPEFQRGFVWTRDQVKSLFRSLYLNYPVGGVLLWEADVSVTPIRKQVDQGVRLLLLDGQQRITSLYSVLRGHPPEFFDGDPEMFNRLCFDVAAEEFRFIAPRHNLDNNLFSVSEVVERGVGDHLERLECNREQLTLYVNRLNRLAQIPERDMPEQRITDEHKTLDAVVEIFNKVNSSGTRLSKADLSLARICSRLPRARQDIRRETKRWASLGYKFSTDWFLRNVTAVAAGRVDFASLENIRPDRFADALNDTPGYIDYFLRILADQLGLDHDRILPGRTSMPLMSAFLHQHGGSFPNAAERDKALYWFMVASISGRHRSSTETTLNQDIATLERDGIDRLLTSLMGENDTYVLAPSDFDESNINARTLPLTYLLAARSEGTPIDTPAEHADLVIRPIFPRSMLRVIGFPARYINAVANYVWIDRECPWDNSADSIEANLAYLEEMSPGAISRQCIPEDRRLWRVEHYPEFLEQRRKLLAGASQKVLEGLRP